MRIRPMSTWAVTAVAAAATLAACGGSDAPADGAVDCPWEVDESITSEVRIAYQNIPNGDLVVKDRQILETCAPNATIEWTVFDSGGNVVQAFGAGSVDLGLVGSSPATRALSDPLNLPIEVVWIHDVIGAAESLVVRDGAASDITGLEGQTIATPFGSTAHYSLLQAIDDAGQDPSDYEIINAEPNTIAPSWTRGDIDAAWIWEPTLSELVAADGEVILTSEDTAEAGKPTFDLAIADAQFVEDNADFLELWARAQDWAVQQLLEDVDFAAESIAVEAGISVDEAKAQLEGLVFLRAEEQIGPDFLGGKLGDDLFQTAEFLLAQDEIGAISEASVYSDGVNPAPAEAAAE